MLHFTLAAALALNLPTTPRSAPPASSTAALSRRTLVQSGTAAVTALGLASSASAEEEKFSKLGGLLEPFQDIGKGYKLYVPSGWTKVRVTSTYENPLPAHLRCASVASNHTCTSSPHAQTSRASQYDTDPGVYDVKFADIIEPFETVIVRRAANPASSPTPPRERRAAASAGQQLAG